MPLGKVLDFYGMGHVFYSFKQKLASQNKKIQRITSQKKLKNRTGGNGTMTSQQIEYVLAVAEQRSFSKAAQKLYVTQPALSQYVMNIEKQLGVQLFDRSTSPIRLTQAGEAFVRSAEQIKVIEDNLMNELSDIAEIKSGSLKIGASTFRASCLLS